MIYAAALLSVEGVGDYIIKRGVRLLPEEQTDWGLWGVGDYGFEPQTLCL